MLSLLSDIWHTYSAQKVEEEEGNVPKLITIIKKKCVLSAESVSQENLDAIIFSMLGQLLLICLKLLLK